jgi:hypothetical protein
MLVDIQTISIVIAASGLFIAAVNQILSRRRTEAIAKLTLDTRQAQLFMQIYNRWASREIMKAYGVVRYKYTEWKNFDELWKQTSPAIDPEQYADHMILHAFYEGLGVLVKKGLIDVSLVEDLFAGRIMWHYERYKSAFKDARIKAGDPKMYNSIEYLYNEQKKRQKQQDSSN